MAKVSKVNDPKVCEGIYKARQKGTPWEKVNAKFGTAGVQSWICYFKADPDTKPYNKTGQALVKAVQASRKKGEPWARVAVRAETTIAGAKKLHGGEAAKQPAKKTAKAKPAAKKTTKKPGRKKAAAKKSGGTTKRKPGRRVSKAAKGKPDPSQTG